MKYSPQLEEWQPLVTNPRARTPPNLPSSRVLDFWIHKFQGWRATEGKKKSQNTKKEKKDRLPPTTGSDVITPVSRMTMFTGNMYSAG